jgi:site-specific DNA-methyltransferase (adenine-specific)
MKSLPRNTILTGDARTVLADLLAGSVDAAITSPPYFQLRDYAVPGQLGLEASIEQWVEALRAVFGEVARVLKPQGALWLNLGDTYSRRGQAGAPPKSLLLGPERLLLALLEDGWLVRNKVVWAKRNPMPESVTDRLATTWEGLYLLTRSARYFFDLDAIREPHGGATSAKPSERHRRYQGGNGGLGALKAAGRVGHPLGKNPGDVWSLPKATFRGAHFATFPPALIERPLLATVPERICVQCDRPWRRRVSARKVFRHRGDHQAGDRYVRRYGSSYDVIRTRGELSKCACFAPARAGVVLDPFFGTGTVGAIAAKHGRDWLGIELSAHYVDLARQRIARAVVDGCTAGGRSLGSFCQPHQPSTTSKEVGP